jgi:hypothetical protein
MNYSDISEEAQQRMNQLCRQTLNTILEDLAQKPGVTIRRAEIQALDAALVGNEDPWWPAYTNWRYRNPMVLNYLNSTLAISFPYGHFGHVKLTLPNVGSFKAYNQLQHVPGRKEMVYIQNYYAISSATSADGNSTETLYASLLKAYKRWSAKEAAALKTRVLKAKNDELMAAGTPVIIPTKKL